MRSIALVAVATLVLAVAACTDTGGAAITPSAAAPSGPTTADASVAPDDTAFAPTPVPGGQSVDPGPAASHKPTTTKTDWGVILDGVPEDFPRYPGAKDVDAPPDEAVSAAYETGDGVDAVARWYQKALEESGFSTLDLSDPLEDGSRVLDSQGDLPECQTQVAFRPAGGSTMITVLYAAGCAALGG
jgi:hypothetical protein